MQQMRCDVGGDEFVVLAQQVDKAGDVSLVAEKIIAELSRPLPLRADSEYHVTASVGISIFGIDAVDEQSLLHHADAAVYLAEQQGKNGFRFYEPAPTGQEPAPLPVASRPASFERQQARANASRAPQTRRSHGISGRSRHALARVIPTRVMQYASCRRWPTTRC
jgi:Diguanylate cyclase, GGDEF domain